MLNLFKGDQFEQLNKELLKTNIEVNKVEKILSTGIDINTVDDKGRTILFSLAAKKKIDAVKLLIQKGIDLNREDKYGHTVLNDAISRSDGLMIRYFLDNGMSVNRVNSAGRTLLQDVALEENHKVFEILMKYNPDFNMKDNYGKTVLFDAVQGGNIKIIREVLHNVDELNLQDSNGQTVLFDAVLKDDPDITKTLVSNGIDVNILDKKKRNVMYNAVVKGSLNLTIIHDLIAKKIKLNVMDIDNISLIDEILEILMMQENGHLESLEGVYKHIKEESTYSDVIINLVENGLLIDRLDKSGNGILVHQIEKENYNNLNFLLQCGADINVKDEKNRTPLFKVLKKGIDSIKMIEFLIDNGSDIENKNINDRSVVDDIIEMSFIEKGHKKLEEDSFKGLNREGNFQEVLKRILKYKPSLDVKRKDGRTTLFDVVVYNDLEMIKILFNYGVNPNLVDEKGNSPLSLMVEEGLKIEAGKQRELFLERLVFLLKFRVNVDLQDQDGRTIFHKAVIADDLVVIEKLLTKKADLTIKDKQGRTALHHTQWKGNYKIARWLMASGANMDEPDNAGFTLLNYAAILGHVKLVVALISSGVLMYNKNPKSKKVAEFFKAKESNLNKLIEANVTDIRMKKALEEVAENLIREINAVLER